MRARVSSLSDEDGANMTNGSWTNGTEETEIHYSALILLLIPALTIFGNVLVVLSILRERSLQSVTNYFILSLAIADFLVALIVMPFAVAVEVFNGSWIWGEALCNIYFACDVCTSTASIFNLLAISFDRFIAITRPIQYSRHGRNTTRAWITISVVWLASVLIALPMVTGINVLEENSKYCVFTQPVYVITSSIGSFYIPCFLMAFLYAVIMKRLRERAKLSNARRMTNRTSRINTPFTSTFSSGDDPCGTQSCHHNNGLHPGKGIAAGMALLGGAKLIRDIGGRLERLGSVDSTEQTTGSATNSSEEEDNVDHSMLSANYRPQEQQKTSLQNRPITYYASKKRRSSTGSIEIKNERIFVTAAAETDEELVTQSSELRSFGDNLAEQIPFIDSSRPGSLKERHGIRLANHDDTIEQFPDVLRQISDSEKIGNGESPVGRRFSRFFPRAKDILLQKNSFRLSLASINARIRKLHLTDKVNKIKTRHMVKKEHRQIRKEQKATQTLAVVLVVFLVCWVPFFTLHTTNSICLVATNKECFSFLPFFLTTWLGYMNSVPLSPPGALKYAPFQFMNPIIYTIFNPEYRKAFRKILTCSRV